MEQTVIERPFYLEHRSSHLHTPQNGAADRIGTHFQQDQYQSGDSRRWIGQDRANMYSRSVAGASREFLSDRSYQGLPYQHEIEPASRIPGFRAANVNNNYRTSESLRFHTGYAYKHDRSAEQLPRIAEASNNYGFGDGHPVLSSHERGMVNPHGYDRSAEQLPIIAEASNNYGFGDGHSVLSSHERGMANPHDYDRTAEQLPRIAEASNNYDFGNGHLALSSHERVMVNPHGYDRSAEQLPRIAEASNNYGFGDGHSVLSSHERGMVNPHDYARTGSFPREPRNRPPCQYFPGGSSHQAVPSLILQPVTVYERTKYDFDTQHHPGATTISSNLHFDRGNVVREDECRGVHPPQALHPHHKEWATNEQFVRDRDVASGSGSSKRKSSEPPSNFGDDQLKPEVKFTMGKRTKEQLACVRDVSEASDMVQEPVGLDLTSSKKYHVVPGNATTNVLEKNEISNAGLNLSHEVNEKLDETKHILNTTPIVLEMDGVNIDLNRERNEKYEDTKPIVKINKKRHKRSKKRRSRLPMSSMGVTSLDHQNEIQHLMNTTPVVLVKDAVDGVNLDFYVEINGKSDDTNPIVETKLKMRKRVRKKRRSSKPGVESMTEVVTDISSQRLPMSSVGVTSMDHENETKHIMNSTPVVLEKDAVDGVNVDFYHEINGKSDDTNPIVETKFKRRKRAPKRRRSSKPGVESMTEVVTDISSQRLPMSSVGVTSMDHENETKDIMNSTPVLLEKDALDGVNIDLNFEINGKSEDSNPIGKTKCKKRKRGCKKRKSSKPGVESMTEEVTDISSQRLPSSSMGVTSLAHKNVVSVLEVTNDSCTSVPQTEEMTDTSCQRLQAPSVEGTFLDPESVVVPVSGVTDVVSTTGLEKDELAEATIDLSHEINEKLEETMHLEMVDSKRKRKKHAKSSKCVVESDFESACVREHIYPVNTTKTLLEKDEIAGVNGDLIDDSCTSVPQTEEMTDTSCQRLPVPSMEGTFLDPESVVVPVSGVTDVVCAKGLEKDELAGATIDLSHEINEKLEETMHLEIVDSKRKRKHVQITTKAVLENDEMAGMNIDLNHDMNDKPKGAKLESAVVPVSGVTDVVSTKGFPRSDIIRDLMANCGTMESEFARACEKYYISRANATMAVLKKDGSHGEDAHQSPELNEKLEEINHMLNTTAAVLEKDELAGASIDLRLSNEHLVPEEGMLRYADNSSLHVSRPSDTGILKSRRKLLVLDVNGLLADIANPSREYEPDFRLSKKKAVFKRPFCDDFLNFCFEKFDVGIWSSRLEINLTKTVDFLFENTKNQLLFCWDNSHCTETRYMTLQNSHRPLVLKELTKLWENKDKDLPWQRGFYDESNTILLDDSPYKALRNPPFTAVFPHSYKLRNVDDISLGPNGGIRLYLERLAEAENVQHFIEANPFGQKAINESNPSWGFYSKIAEAQEEEFASTSNGRGSSKRRRHR